MKKPPLFFVLGISITENASEITFQPDILQQLLWTPEAPSSAHVDHHCFTDISWA